MFISIMFNIAIVSILPEILRKEKRILLMCLVISILTCICNNFILSVGLVVGLLLILST
jgi:hypothetical protein